MNENLECFKDWLLKTESLVKNYGISMKERNKNGEIAALTKNT